MLFENDNHGRADRLNVYIFVQFFNFNQKYIFIYKCSVVTIVIEIRCICCCFLCIAFRIFDQNLKIDMNYLKACSLDT